MPPDDQNDPGRLMREALRDARQIERHVHAGPVQRRPSGWSGAWRLLRRAARELLRGFEENLFKTPDASSLPAEWQGRQQELQARSLQADALLRELELRQETIDREWEGALSELGRLEDDWLRLKEETSAAGLEAPAVLLQEGLARLDAAWTEILEEDRASEREREAFAQAWRRISGGLAARLEKLVASAQPDIARPWARVAGQIQDIDRRWRQADARVKQRISGERTAELADRLALEEGRSAQLSRRLVEALRRVQELESLTHLGDRELTQRLDTQGRSLERVQAECHRLSQELDRSKERVDRLQGSRRALRKALSRRRREWLGARGRAEEYFAALRESSAGLEQARAEVLGAHLEKTRGEREIEALKEQLIELSRGAQPIQEMQRVLRTQRDELVRELDSAQQVYGGVCAELKTLQRAHVLSQLEAKQRLLERDAAQKEMSRLTERLASSEEASRLLGAQKESLHLEIEALRRQADSLRVELDALKAKGTPPSSLQALGEAAPLVGESVFPESPAIPPMAPAQAELESAWSRAAALVLQPIAAAHAHLRRLASGGLAEGQRAIVSMAAGSVAQAQDAVKMLEVYAEEPAEAPVPTGLQAVVNSVLAAWEPAFRRRGVAIVQKLEPSAAAVRLHPEPARVAIYQVVRNAYEAMPRGGCLTVRLWQEKPSSEVCLSFSDTGPGFPEHVLRAPLAPFANPRPGHMGLGLGLARRVLRRIGAEVTAENSSAKGGALVSFRFPV